MEPRLEGHPPERRVGAHAAVGSFVLDARHDVHEERPERFAVQSNGGRGRTRSRRS